MKRSANNISFPSSLAIRCSQQADIDFIYDCLLAMSVEEKISDRFSITKAKLATLLYAESPIAEVLIAEIANVQVGLLLFSETNRNFTLFRKSGLYIHDLYVVPAYRREGIASSLMNKVKVIAKQRDYDRIDWVVLQDNQAGKRFYSSIPEAQQVEYIQYMRIQCVSETDS